MRPSIWICCLAVAVAIALAIGPLWSLVVLAACIVLLLMRRETSYPANQVIAPGSAAVEGRSGDPTRTDFLTSVRDEPFEMPNPFTARTNYFGTIPEDVRSALVGREKPTHASISWRKNIGDEFQRGEVIFEGHTEVAGFEVCAPAAGALAKILVQNGEMVPFKTVVGVVRWRASFATLVRGCLRKFGRTMVEWGERA
jgi:hypothetical protein